MLGGVQRITELPLNYSMDASLVTFTDEKLLQVSVHSWCGIVRVRRDSNSTGNYINVADKCILWIYCVHVCPNRVAIGDVSGGWPSPTIIIIHVSRSTAMSRYVPMESPCRVFCCCDCFVFSLLGFFWVGFFFLGGAGFTNTSQDVSTPVRSMQIFTAQQKHTENHREAFGYCLCKHEFLPKDDTCDKF